MIIVPKNINYISASLTLRCNLGCSYCINAFSEINRKRKELSGQEWIAGLNNLQIESDTPITLEGGEPTLHPDFYEIVDKVSHPLNILTNLSFNVNEFIRNIDPRRFPRMKNRSFKDIRISYHAQNMDQDELIEKAIELQEAGFRIGIFGISHPNNIAKNIEMAEKCRRATIYFFIKDYLGYFQGEMIGIYRYPEALDGDKKSCLCRTSELLISPTGDIFKCHSDMYENGLPIGNLINDKELEIFKFRPCPNFGKCNPCDVKLKTNRFLEAGHSSVEIIEVL